MLHVYTCNNVAENIMRLLPTKSNSFPNVEYVSESGSAGILINTF